MSKSRRPTATYRVNGREMRLKEALPVVACEEPGLTRPEMADRLSRLSDAPDDQVKNAVYYGMKYVVDDAVLDNQGRIWPTVDRMASGNGTGVPQRLQDLFDHWEQDHEAYLDGVRAVLYVLAQEQGWVSTDDMWRLIRAGEIPGPPEDMHHNAFGGLFAHDDRFEAGEMFRSKRDGHHNAIRKWRAV